MEVVYARARRSAGPNARGLREELAQGASLACPCAGFVGMSQLECESRTCCWHPAEFETFPHVDLPWCFKPNANASEYGLETASRTRECWAWAGFLSGEGVAVGGLSWAGHARECGRCHCTKRMCVVRAAAAGPEPGRCVEGVGPAGSGCAATAPCAHSPVSNMDHKPSPPQHPQPHATHDRGHALSAVGLRGRLRLRSGGSLPELGEDIDALDMELTEVGAATLRLTLRDAARSRWEVPTDLLDSEFFAPRGGVESGAAAPRNESIASGDATAQRDGVRVLETQGGSRIYAEYHADPFWVRVWRKGQEGRHPAHERPPLFDTRGARLVFRDQYLELSTAVPAATTLYGAGERASHTQHLARNGAPRPIWARDIGPTLLEQNMYGAHPFVMGVEDDGDAWGLLLLSSNAMDAVPSERGLTWRVTGGIVDAVSASGGLGGGGEREGRETVW